MTASPGLKVVAPVMFLREQPVAGKKESYSFNKKTKQRQGYV